MTEPKPELFGSEYGTWLDSAARSRGLCSTSAAGRAISRDLWRPEWLQLEVRAGISWGRPRG